MISLRAANSSCQTVGRSPFVLFSLLCFPRESLLLNQKYCPCTLSLLAPRVWCQQEVELVLGPVAFLFYYFMHTFSKYNGVSYLVTFAFLRIFHSSVGKDFTHYYCGELICLRVPNLLPNVPKW